MDIGCEVEGGEKRLNKAFFILDEVNPKVSIFINFDEKSLSGGQHAHIINKTPNLNNPANCGLLRPHQGTKKRGRHRKNLPVAGVLR